MDNLQDQIQQIHLKLGLLSIDIFEKSRQYLFEKGYKIQEYISKGGQAEVFKGYSEIHKRECAIRLSANTIEDYQSLLQEFETIKHIKMPMNIVELLAVEFLEDIKICAHILELCQFSLEDEMQTFKKNNTWFKEEEQYFIIFSLCDALNEIQSYEIIHFDIKPSNILKTMKGEYVLSDFGMSKRIPKNQSSINKAYGFSFAYISPEQCQNIEDQNEKITNLTPISYQSDLYSMSIVILQILGFQVDLFFNQKIRDQQFQWIVLEQNQKIIFEQFRKSLLGVDPNSRIEAFRLQQFFLNVLNIKNNNFLKKYQNKVEDILEQNKYDNSKNIQFSSKLHHEYSFTHFYISQIINCKYQESLSLTFLGLSYDRLMFPDKAIEFFLQSLEIKKSLYKGIHTEISKSLNSIGVCYVSLNKFDKALEYYQQSLEMKLSLYDGNHPDISMTLNNIGGCYDSLGNLEKSIEYQQQSFEMNKYFFEKNHPDIVMSLSNLGSGYQTLKKFDQALLYFYQSLLMSKSLNVGIHPDTARSLMKLGTCCYDLRKFDKALKYNLQSLEMRRSLYERNHPEIDGALFLTGLYYKALGKLDKSLEYFHQSLEMRLSLYGKIHFYIQVSLEQIGQCYKTLGKADQSIKYLLQALEMQKSLYQGSHSEIVKSLYNLGFCYETFGNNDKALEYYLQSLEMEKSLCQGSNLEIAYSLSNIGGFFYTVGNTEKAIEYQQQSFDILQSLLKGNHPAIADSLNKIGICYVGFKKIDKALDYFLQSLEMKLSLYGQIHPEIADSLNNICKCYQTLGNVDKYIDCYQFYQYVQKSLLENSFSQFQFTQKINLKIQNSEQILNQNNQI